MRKRYLEYLREEDFRVIFVFKLFFRSRGFKGVVLMGKCFNFN